MEDFHTYFVSELGVWVHNTCLVSEGGSKTGFTIEESKAYVRYADNYFMGELGLTLDSPTRIPGNRKGH